MAGSMKEGKNNGIKLVMYFEVSVDFPNPKLNMFPLNDFDEMHPVQ